MAFTKIAAAGIGSTETVTLHSLEVLNDATVGGVLTYEDVTNVDSIGIVTARAGVLVGSGITLSKDGDIFATGVTTSTTFVGNLTGNVTGNISGGTVAGSTGTFTGDVDIADKIIHTGDTNTAIRFPSADTITFETAGNERLRVSSDGKVGIGTNAPENNLTVTSSNDNAVLIKSTSTDQYHSARIHLQGGGTATDNVTALVHGNNNSGGSESYFAIESKNSSQVYVKTLALYNHSTDAWDFNSGSGGTTSLRIASNGDIGLGTVPETDSYQPSLYFAGGNANIWGSGNVNLYTAVNARYTGAGGWKYNNDGVASYVGQQSGVWNFFNAPSGTADATATFTERVRINSLGQLYINTNTSNDTMFGIKNSASYDFITCRNSSNTLKMYVHHSGNLYNTNGNYSQISDQSLKENIVDANSQWDDIKNIRIRNFNFTAASGMDTHTQIGCVAQEVETVSPKLVSAPKDGVKTVANSVLYMKAVKALQEAQTRIETLEAKVAALEG